MRNEKVGRHPRGKKNKKETRGSKSQTSISQIDTSSAGTTPSQPNEASTTPPPSIEKKKSNTFNRWLYNQSKRLRRYLVAQLILVLPAIVLLLLGFKDLPKSVPLLDIMKQYPIATPVIGGVLILLFLPMLIISFGPEPKDDNTISNTSPNRWWIIASALSATSFVLSSTLLIIVLIRPPGCPTVLCSPPQTITQVVTNPRGVHDANLEVYFLTLQSTFFVIPGNPSQYSQNDLPQNTGAVRLDGKPSPSLYRVVLGVHSLQQGRYGLLITQVALEIRQVPLMPRPLNVWAAGSSLDYHTNPYLAVYKGQIPGDTLPASYLPIPYAHVQLSPGEADQLDIQVSSQVLADIQFRVQISYRITNEAQMHSLILPATFEVMFSDQSNWHEYQLQNGHFVTSP